MQQPATARAGEQATCQSRCREDPWRPPESTWPLAKSFVLRQTVCKRLIFLKCHGRGREFESHQVHQIPRTLTAPPPRLPSRTGSKTKLIRQSSRGTNGIRVALLSLSRDGDNRRRPRRERPRCTEPRRHGAGDRHGSVSRHRDRRSHPTWQSGSESRLALGLACKCPHLR